MRKRGVFGCRPLTKEFTARAHADELQNLYIRFAIDKQQIGPEVAFAMVAPLARQPMVAVLLR
jgi:hypothetical protein